MAEVKPQMRGSEALRAAWQQRGEPLDDDTVELLASQFDELEALQVTVEGGERPHSIAGTFSSDDPDRCGNTVRNLLGLGSRVPVRIKVFPRGIPWPDQFIVEVVAGQTAQR